MTHHYDGIFPSSKARKVQDQKPVFYIQFDGCCGSNVYRRTGRRWHKLYHWSDGSVSWVLHNRPKGKLATIDQIRTNVEQDFRNVT